MGAVIEGKICYQEADEQEQLLISSEEGQDADNAMEAFPQELISELTAEL